MRRLELAILVATAMGGCHDDVGEIRRAQQRTRGTDRVPVSAVAEGNDPETGLPLGYPPSMPLVPGGRALSGGVDPGVIRTCTLSYDHLTIDGYIEALNRLLEADHKRVVRTFTTESGSKQLRLDLGDGYASVIVADAQGQLRVDVSALDRARTTP